MIAAATVAATTDKEGSFFSLLCPVDAKTPNEITECDKRCGVHNVNHPFRRARMVAA